MNRFIKNNKFNFKCLNHKCPKNCCGPHFSNAEGLIKASPVFEPPKNTVPLTDKEARFVIKKFGQDKVLKIEGAGYHIRQTEENACCFYDTEENKCSIYKDRFNSCRSYPFFFDKYWGLCIDESCPGVGAGWTNLPEIEEKIECLVKVYKSRFSELKKFKG